MEVTYEQFIDRLKEKLSSTPINLVKADVEPFVLDRRELLIWSNEYFLMLADKMQVREQ